MAHALFGASAAHRWLACPGSLALAVTCGGVGSLPRSPHAAEGTIAHLLFESAMLGTREPREWLGEEHASDNHVIGVDLEMVSAVEQAAQWARRLTEGALSISAETRVYYGDWLGVPDDEAFGTADLIAIVGDELQVHDYKHGRGVPVKPDNNPQLMLYAGGALPAAQAIAEISRVRLVIHQPRVNDGPLEWTTTPAELEQWLHGEARSGAASVRNAVALLRDWTPDWDDIFLRTGDHCRWCPAKAVCPALRDEVTTDVWGAAPAAPAEFDLLGEPVRATHSDQEWVAKIVPKLDLIESWCRDVRGMALVFAEEGTLPGYKIVQGRRGARAWADPTEAEKLLRTVFRLPIEKAYDLKLISPTAVEKLAAAGDIGVRQWKKAQALIVQPDGKPHLAPVSDPRPALSAAITDFDPAPAAEDIC